MASKTAILSVRIISDAKKAVAGFKEAVGGLDKLEGGLKKVQPAATVAAGAVIALGKQSLDSASKLQQSTGAVEAVFKGQSEAIKSLAADAADSVGLSANQYQEFASVMGSQLKNLGVSQGDLVGTTDKLITMGADLASMFGGTTADAVEALSAAFRGEYDPIEKYGISIKKSDINARLAADGLEGLEGEAQKQAETQALLAMLTEQSADAMGNFQRETDTAAGSAQIAAANWENAKATLGEALLPYATQAAEKLAALATAVAAHPQLFGAMAAAVVGVAGAINGALLAIKAFQAAQTIVTAVSSAWTTLGTSMLAVRTSMVVGNVQSAAQSAAAWVAAGTRAAGAWVAAGARAVASMVRTAAQAAATAARAAAAWLASTARMAAAWVASTARIVAQLAIQKGAMLASRAATMAMAAAQGALNLVMNANPIGLVVAAVAALAAGLYTAYQKSETFRNAVNAAGRIGKQAFEICKNAIMGVVDWVANLINRAGGIGGIFQTSMNIARNAVYIVTAPFRTLLSIIQSVVDWIQSISFPSPPEWVDRLIGSAQPFSMPTTGGAMFTAAGPGSFAPLGAVVRNVSRPADVDNRTIINVNVSDSVVGDERLLAETVTRAIRRTNRNAGRVGVYA